MQRQLEAVLASMVATGRGGWVVADAVADGAAFGGLYAAAPAKLQRVGEQAERIARAVCAKGAKVGTGALAVTRRRPRRMWRPPLWGGRCDLFGSAGGWWWWWL